MARTVGVDQEDRPSAEISMDPSEREDAAADAQAAREQAAHKVKQSVKPDLGRGWTGTEDEYKRAIRAKAPFGLAPGVGGE